MEQTKSDNLCEKCGKKALRRTSEGFLRIKKITLVTFILMMLFTVIGAFIFENMLIYLILVIILGFIWAVSLFIFLTYPKWDKENKFTCSSCGSEIVKTKMNDNR